MSDFQLLKGDCLEVMKEIPDNSIYAVICDPPYGTTACKWDSVIPLDLMWSGLKRIVKPYSPIVLFSQQPFTTKLIHSNIESFKYDWTWKKTVCANFQQAPNMPQKKTEGINVFSFDGVVGHKSQTKKRMTYNPQGTSETHIHCQRAKLENDEHVLQRENGIIKGYTQTVTGYPETLLEYKSAHNPPHPTQKPLALMEYLVKTYTNEGDVVLDFTMGSGTTGVACLNTKRKFIGIEKDSTYYNIAKSRIEGNTNVNELF